MVPIEQPDLPESVAPKHRRNDRCFLPYGLNGLPDANVRKARKTLQHICKIRLASIVEARAFDIPIEEDVLNLIAATPEDVQPVIRNFVEKNYPVPVDQAFAKVYKILATECPVISFVPYRYLAEIDNICTSQLNRPMCIDSLRGYAPELHALLRSAQDEVSYENALTLLRYLVKFVHDLHDGDNVHQEAVPVENSYDPESGIAYYFIW